MTLYLRSSTNTVLLVTILFVFWTEMVLYTLNPVQCEGGTGSKKSVYHSLLIYSTIQETIRFQYYLTILDISRP